MKKPENVIETEEYVEPHCFENDQEAALFCSYLEQEKYIAHLESKVLNLSQHLVSVREIVLDDVVCTDDGKMWVVTEVDGGDLLVCGNGKKDYPLEKGDVTHAH